MQYDGSIRINTAIDSSGITKALNRIGSDFKSFSNAVKGAFRAILPAASIAGLIALGKQAAEAASDLQEVQNVVDTAFGEMSYKMEQFADTAVKQFGISKLSAKEMGSTFAAMGRSMVGSLDEATDMAIALTGRAADMASFYNKEVSETSTALKAVYTGETEVLKQYGVVMTEVNLQEYAATKGITKKLSAMTQAEKVHLRYNYVMEQTSLAAGDFEKTSNSWANQTRILSEQLKELLGVLGNGITTVLTPAINALNAILTSLISIAKQIGSLLSGLFGIQAQTQSTAAGITGIAEGLGESETNADGLTDGITDAGEAAEKAAGKLAAFDTLEVLKKDSSDSGGGAASAAGAAAAEAIEGASIADAAESIAEEVSGILLQMFAPLKEAWESEGQFVMDSWRYALGEIGLTAQSVGSDFLEVWQQAESVTILENILHILGDIGLVIGNLAQGFREAWDENNAGKQVLENIRDIIGDIVEHIRGAADATVLWSQNLDFSPLLTSILGLLQSLEPLADNIGAGLEWFYTNVLLPLASWTIEDAIPAFLDLLAAGLDVLNATIEALEPLAIWLWDEFLQPVAAWAGDLAIAAIETLMGLLKDFGDWISGHTDLVQGFVEVIGTFFAAWKIADLAVTIAGIVAALASFVATGGLATAAAGALGAAVAFLTSPIALVTAAIAAVIAIGILLYNHWDELKEWATETWESIKENIGDRIEAAKETLDEAMENIRSFWEDKWDAIKKKASDIWESITEIVGGARDTLKGIINSILGFVESMANGVVNAINTVIRALNALHFDIPDWVPELGGKSFGFNLSELSEVKIPRLASGAVIRGGDPFAAILGDQRRGQTNIEAPASLIRDMAMQGFAEAIQDAGAREAQIVLDGEVIGRLMMPHFLSEWDRAGYSLSVLE